MNFVGLDVHVDYILSKLNSEARRIRLYDSSMKCYWKNKRKRWSELHEIDRSKFEKFRQDARYVVLDPVCWGGVLKCLAYWPACPPTCMHR